MAALAKRLSTRYAEADEPGSEEEEDSLPLPAALPPTDIKGYSIIIFL